MPSTYLPRSVLREADALEAFGNETRLLDQLEQVRTAPPPPALTPFQSRLPEISLPTWEELSGEKRTPGGHLADISGGMQAAPSRSRGPSFAALNPPTPESELPSWEDLTGESSRPAIIPDRPPSSTPSLPSAGAGSPAAAAGAPDVQIDRSSMPAFMGSFLPAAQAALQAKGLPTSLAPILAAIPVNEQGWQKPAPGNNYYGIKGSNPRTGANTGPVATWEDYGSGRENIQDTFRAYASPAESVQDFIGFLEDNPRYAGALKVARETGDPAAFVKAVHAAGYATDPAWSDKILSIARQAPQTAPPAATAPASAPGASEAPSVTQRAAESRVASGELTPNQLTAGKELSSADALAACGPAAAVAFARRNGRNPTLDEAVQLAKEVGWTPASGMAGPASQVNLLRKMGVESTLEWAADPGKIAGSVQQGNPVIIDTPGHYFVAESYDPQTGKFDFGNSARILKAAGGKTQFTLAELPGLGMGAPRATIYMQSPLPQETAAAPPDKGVAVDAQANGVGGDVLASLQVGKGAGLPNAQALEPGPRAAASDSTFGPFDPPGYSQDSTFGTFDPPGYGGVASATPPIADQPNILQRAGQGIGDLSRGLVSGLNQTAQDIGNQFTPRTEPTAPRFETDEGPGPAAPLIAPLGQTVRNINAAAQPLPDESAARDAILARTEASDLPEAAKIALRGMQSADDMVSYLNKLLGSAVYTPIRDTIIKPIIGSVGLEHHTELPVLGEVGTADVVAGLVPGLGALGGAANARGMGPLIAPSSTLIGRGVQAAADSGAGRAVGEALGGLRDTAKAMTRGLPGGAPVASAVESDRYYHGTGAAFDTPNPATFDENGLFGPGYYLTSDPRVAGSYADTRSAGLKLQGLQQVASELKRQLAMPDLDARLGPEYRASTERQLASVTDEITELQGTAVGSNVRAVDVPRGLRLLDAEAPVTARDRRAVERAFAQSGPDTYGAAGPAKLPLLRQQLDEELPRAGASWDTVHRMMSGVIGGENTNKVLASMGYDGISYSGGKRIPMADEVGQPIEHRATLIFPSSLDKITNATSGRPGGLLPSAAPLTQRLAGQAVGGAVAGGYSASQEEGADLGSVARGAALGAVGGVARGALGRPGTGQIVARAVGANQGRHERSADLARPIVLSTEDEIKRLRLDKFPAELHDDLLNAAKGTNFGQGLRRGVLSDQAVQTLAEEYAPTVEQAIAGGRRGRAYSAEEIVALRNLMVGQTERVRALGDVLTKSTEGGQIDVVAMAQHVAEQRKLALLGNIVFGGAPAEAGRALRQFRQLAQSLEQDPMRAGLRFIQKQYGGLDKAEAAVAQYQAQVEMGADPVQLTKFLRQIAQPGLAESWLNRIGIIRYAGMLSGTATHVLNATGNAIMQGSDVATGVLGAGIDAARVAAARKAGLPATRAIFLEETPARLLGMASGARTGLAEAAFIMRHGFHPEAVTKLDHLRAGFGTNVPGVAPAGSARAEVVDFLAEGPLRALGAADAIFRGTSMGGWTAAEATAKVMKEHGGKPAPASEVLEAMEHQDVLDRADNMAHRSVLQEDTAARRFAGWVRTQPAAVQSVISQVAPFMSTPYALVAQGVGMTPAGVVKVIGDARKGNIRGAEEQLARVALGTALMQVSDAQYLAGNLTGPRPESEAERSTLPPGWREWSFRVAAPDGQVHYVPMALAGPFAIPMVVGILKAEAGKQGQPFTPERLGETALGIGRFAADQTFLQGVSQLSAALERGGSKIEGYVESIAASYSPHLAGGGALGRELQQLMGMPQRNPQGALEALEATFPYLAPNVPVRRDVLGRPQQTAPGGLETALLRSTAGQDEPILQVFREAGEGLPMAAPKEVMDTAYKRRVPLDRDQQDTWRQLFGRELETRWRDAGRSRDPKVLRRIEGEARDAAAARVLGR